MGNCAKCGISISSGVYCPAHADAGRIVKCEGFTNFSRKIITEKKYPKKIKK